MHIEVVYAPPGDAYIVLLDVPDGTTAGAAAALARPAMDRPPASDAPLGVWGKQVSPDTVLKDGDRVEIYRPLSIDPKEARRRLAEAAGRKR